MATAHKVADMNENRTNEIKVRNFFVCRRHGWWSKSHSKQEKLKAYRSNQMHCQLVATPNDVDESKDE